MNNFNVVIAPQNWTFHNTNNLNHYQNGVVIAQFKTGPSTTRFARANPQKRCNSPSKPDLPQLASDKGGVKSVVIVPQNRTFHNCLT